jgi:hypothetical protein
MGRITAAHAWANNEVAYVAWDIDGKIDGCLGFEVTRVYLNDDGTIASRVDGTEDRVKCAAWVAFKGQRNPHWLPQDTGVWPVQKLSWRDLTLRKKRDGMTRRPDEVLVRYEIWPVGDLRLGLRPVPSNGREFADIVKRDSEGRPALGADGKPIKERVKAYEGKPRPLAYHAPATMTNDVRITTRHGPFRTTFTNGILAAQWLRNVLNEDGVIDKNELYEKIVNPADPHRKYLAGDVIPLIHELFGRKGTFYLGLYELEDEELEEILIANAARIHVILANTRLGEDKKWDTRNKAARKRLMDAGVDIEHRMFNTAPHRSQQIRGACAARGRSSLRLNRQHQLDFDGLGGSDKRCVAGGGRRGRRRVSRLLEPHENRRAEAAETIQQGDEGQPAGQGITRV